jgi:succinyl-diaminopimelate desuccinylase
LSSKVELLPEVPVAAIEFQRTGYGCVMADLLAQTAALVGMPSVSFEEAPFVDWIESELSDLAHLEVTRVGDNLVARTDLGRSQRLILAGHTDTVPVNGNAEPRIEGDNLWGVGSADMKGGLAVFLDVARTVPNPSVDLTFVFYAREEVAQEHNGLAGARAHTARPWMGRNAVHRLAPILAKLEAYEARTPTIDGCTYREAIQAVSVEGGVAGNVVPDQAVLRIYHRYAPDRTPAEAEAWVRELLSTDIDDGDELVVVDQSPPCAPSLKHPLLSKLVEDNGLEVRAKLGWTDVARFDQLGIPATNLGPGDPTVAHTAGEFLDRASLESVHQAVHKLVG